MSGDIRVAARTHLALLNTSPPESWGWNSTVVFPHRTQSGPAAPANRANTPERPGARAGCLRRSGTRSAQPAPSMAISRGAAARPGSSLSGSRTNVHRKVPSEPTSDIAPASWSSQSSSTLLRITDDKNQPTVLAGVSSPQSSAMAASTAAVEVAVSGPAD
jgi:hypothetical protein